MTKHTNLGVNPQIKLVSDRSDQTKSSPAESRLRGGRVHACRMCSQRMSWLLDALREEKTWGHGDWFSKFVLHGCCRCEQRASYLFLVGSCKRKALKSQQLQLCFRESVYKLESMSYCF